MATQIDICTENIDRNLSLFPSMLQKVPFHLRFDASMYRIRRVLPL